jgi:hypothetical protein
MKVVVTVIVAAALVGVLACLVIEPRVGELQLTWTDPIAYPSDSIVIERQAWLPVGGHELSANSPWVPIASVPLGIQRDVDWSLLIGRMYCYRVRTRHELFRGLQFSEPSPMRCAPARPIAKPHA